MHGPIFSDSVRRRRRLVWYAFVVCLITSWSISSTTYLRPHFHYSLSMIAAAAVDAIGVAFDHGSTNNSPLVGSPADGLQWSINGTETVGSPAETLPWSINATETGKVESLQYCEIKGDIRTESNSATITVVNSLTSTTMANSTIIVEPYPRKNIPSVKKWTVKQVYDNNVPNCTQNHSHPGILFSTSGYTGNLFHDFADVLFPLYLTSFHFQREVHFLASGNMQWWINRFRPILDMLTKHDIINIDAENRQVHCFNKLTAGIRYYKELIPDPSLFNSPNSGGRRFSQLSGRHPQSKKIGSVTAPNEPSMDGFRQLLRQAYSLERIQAIRWRNGETKRPRVIIISRRRTRIITNMGDIISLARELGCEVVVAEAGVSTSMARFAQIVNSCDVLVGMHGAGLTNMVFLPDNAVLIQVIPYGSVDKIARHDFGNPCPGMKLSYFEYKVALKESSLIQQYSIQHPILKDPESFNGWDSIYSIYLKQQNVTIDVHRFRHTLVEALKLLRG